MFLPKILYVIGENMFEAGTCPGVFGTVGIYPGNNCPPVFVRGV